MAGIITKADILTSEIKDKIIRLTIEETPKEYRYLLTDFIEQIKNM